MKYEELYEGQTCSLKRRFSMEDVRAFSELSLDKNSIHLDEKYAKQSPFGKCLVHGFLSASLISGVIGTLLPGKGAIYLNQNLNFRKPVYHDEMITAVCKVINLRKDKPIVTLETICTNEKGEVVIDGTALVKLYED